MTFGGVGVHHRRGRTARRLRAHERSALRRRIGMLQKRLRLQELLVSDIDHRCKNAFQLASSVLSLKAKQASSAEAGECLRNAAHQLVCFSAAHALLNEGDEGVEMRRYLALLASALQPDHARVTIRLDAEAGAWRANKALPLGLLASELVINALKHGFPDGRAGEIVIGLRSEPDHVVFSVSDDGQGWNASPGSGLGSRLIQGLADQIGGLIETRSAPGQGVTARLAIPKAGFDGLIARPRRRRKPFDPLDCLG